MARGRMAISRQVRRSGRQKSDKPNPIDVQVGSRVRLRRNMLGLSQEKLGTAIGLTFQQVQKYERGANRIGASRLHELSRVLDVPVSFFFDGATGPKVAAGNVNEALGLIRTAGALRLVRAFEHMPAEARGHFLALVELVGSGGSSRKPAKTGRRARR